jgi:peptide subunit release factor 1 (eRF1)
MHCREVIPLLSHFLLGTVAAPERTAIEQHLSECAGCRRRLAELNVAGRVFSALPRHEPPPGYSERLLERLRTANAAAAPPSRNTGTAVHEGEGRVVPTEATMVQPSFISPELVEQLVTFRSEAAPVLSVYLNTTPERQTRRAFRIAFRDLVQQLEAQIAHDEERRKALRREAEKVQRFLETYEPHGRGLVIFSCQPAGFWQVYQLPRPVLDNVVFDTSPYVRPLLDILDEYERYAVALVDKERARLFSIYLGQIEERTDFSDLVPPKHKQGGWSQANFQRHHDAHVSWHLKHVATHLADLARRRHFDRLILAGPEEPVTELEHLLPATLRARVVGRLALEYFVTPQTVLDQSLPLIEQVERQSEQRLVTDLLDTARSGGRAVLGIERVLEMLQQGRVWRLVVAEGFRAQGSACPNCGLLSVPAQETCPACGQAMQPAPELVERMEELALQQGAQVETVHGPAATLLQEAGGIGAFIRGSQV